MEVFMNPEDFEYCGDCPVCGEMVDFSEAGFCKTCGQSFHWGRCGTWFHNDHTCNYCIKYIEDNWEK
jgi:hypothetical protein